MSLTPNRAPPPRKSYHHGDLASEAVALALELIESDAQNGLSLRGLAERLGVTHRALYNHFRDRDDLLAAVAATGFDLLTATLADRATPSEFIRAYAVFALSRPAVYALMMRQTYPSFESHAALRAAADRLIAASARILAADLTGEDAVRRAVMRVWMLVHGGVSLQASGVLRGRSTDAFIDELLVIAGLAESRPDPAQPLWSQPR